MKKHSGPTGETTRVELTSRLEQVRWSRAQSAPGARVGLDVFTQFVGNGAPLKIKLTDLDGSSLGTFTDAIVGNHFRAEITVPPNADNALFAHVELPDHNLKADSPPLILGPVVALRKLSWNAREARRGDILTLTADAYEAYDGLEATVTIYEHDSDGAHDLITSIPTRIKDERLELQWAFEYHPDTDDIPTDPEVEQSYAWPEYFFRVDVLGLKADSDLLEFKDTFEVTLKSPTGVPFAGEPFKVTFADGKVVEGKLDDQGRYEVQDVPPGPVEVSFPQIDGEEA